MEVTSFEVSPGKSSGEATVMVFVGAGHPRPIALSLGGEALFGLASAAVGACEQVDRPRLVGILRKISAAHLGPATSPPPIEPPAARLSIASVPASADGFTAACVSLVDRVAMFQGMCRDRGLGDAAIASLVDFGLHLAVLGPAGAAGDGSSLELPWVVDRDLADAEAGSPSGASE